MSAIVDANGDTALPSEASMPWWNFSSRRADGSISRTRGSGELLRKMMEERGVWRGEDEHAPSGQPVARQGAKG